MVLQSMCIPSIMSADLQPLYYRGQATLEDHSLFVPQGQEISFDTYFHLFSVKTWREYTVVEKLSVQVNVSGAGNAVLIGFDHDPAQQKQISSIAFSTETQTAFTLLNETALCELPLHLYIRIKSENGAVRVYSASYTCDKASAQDVHIACCFCTYKREKELIRNILNLFGGIMQNHDSPLYGRIEIYITDNGHTLTRNMLPASKSIHIFQNKNYGGSAGFTRCMIEAVLNNPPGTFSHVVLMDDDAIITPYTVEKTGVIAALLKPEHREKMIGGAMLWQEKPNIQLENGAFIDPKSWRIRLPGKDRDLSDLQAVLANEENARVNYNGWFYCCIPSETITPDNLPLPLFLHADDQEYGVRNKAGILLMNGICIWHPNTWAKKRAYIEYYDARNGMIALSKTNPKMPPWQVCLRELVSVLCFMLSYRYDDAEYTLRGYEDFYKGPEWFMTQDPEQLNRELMQWKKEEPCELTKEEMIKLDRIGETKRIRRITKKTLNMLLPSFMKRKAFDTNLPWKCISPFCVGEICVIDAETGKGFCLKKSYGRHFRLILKTLRSFFFIFRNHQTIYANWNKHAWRMGKQGYWEALLKLK